MLDKQLNKNDQKGKMFPKILKKLFSYKAVILFLLLFLELNISCEGFIAGTLVKIQGGYVTIEQLKENDCITSYNFKEKNLTSGKIIKATKKHYKKCIKLTISGHEVIAAPDHKFFCPLKKGCWIKAQDIQKNDFVLKEIKDLVRIDDTIELDQENDFYCLSIDKSHNYFVSENHIFVHNVAPVVAGLYAAAAWIAATFEFEFSVALFGAIAYSAGTYKNNERAKDIGKKALATGLVVIAGKKIATNKEARKIAKDKDLKEVKVDRDTHGELVFEDKKGRRFSPDADNHSGGVWKEYDRRNNRIGTLDEDFNRIGD